MRSGERHQPAVAETDRALGARWHRLPRGWRRACRRRRRAGRSRSGRQRRNPSTATAAPAANGARRRVERRRPHERRVAVNDEDVIGLAARSPPWPPAPHARFRAAPAARKASACGSTRCASAATASCPGPITTAVSAMPASAMAASTCARSGRPATACRTFGTAERMRVPSPAASTIARQVRAFIEQLRGVLIAGRPPKVATVVPGSHGLAAGVASPCVPLSDSSANPNLLFLPSIRLRRLGAAGWQVRRGPRMPRPKRSRSPRLPCRAYGESRCGA